MESYRELPVGARQYGKFAYNSFRSRPAESIGRDG